MAHPTLLGISGSLRKSATNSMLVREAAHLFGPCTFIEADLNLPLYSGDDEDAHGIPASVQKLADQIAAADAVIMSTPEYNKGPSGVLKNALDWVSRSDSRPWAGKPLAVMACAAGRSGGERASYVLRSFMVPFRPKILQGPEIHVAANYEAFDENGHLTGELYIKNLTELMSALRAEIG